MMLRELFPGRLPLPRHNARCESRDVWGEGEELLHSGMCWLSGMERHETLQLFGRLREVVHRVLTVAQVPGLHKTL